MPEPVAILQASAVAAILAIIALLVSRALRSPPHPALLSGGGAVGVGAAVFLGAVVLCIGPRLPPRDVLDRYLLILLPASVAAEAAAAALTRWRWAPLYIRLFLVGVTGSILLHGSVYVTGPPRDVEQKPTQAVLLLLVLGFALAVAWLVLSRRAHGAGRSVLAALAVTTAGAACVVIMSGYASGGQLGFPLAAGLAATAIGLWISKADNGEARGAVGVGILGLFALLVAGRFFADLTTTQAAVLFAAPLLTWLPEWLLARRLGPGWRGVAGVLLTVVPVAVVVALAARYFLLATE
jgi:hypothetical protein